MKPQRVKNIKMLIEDYDFMYILHSSLKLGDNCIQNFHLGRYIVGYTVGILVLRRRVYLPK